jgi:O-antigen/teichoic acid export membrane protein
MIMASIRRVRADHVEGSGTDSGSLVRRIGWNGLAQILPLLIQLALTPYFIQILGLDGFGVWSLVLVFVATLTALDGGIGASLARFFAVHAARQDPEQAGRLLLGAVVIFLLLGVLVGGLAAGVAPLVAGWLDLAPALRSQAADALQWLGLLVVLALLNGAVVALLQANHRFGRLTASTAAGQCAYAIAAFVLLRPGDAMVVLVCVLAIRYVVGLVVGFIVASRLVRFRRPLLPTRTERSAFLAYAGRMQVSSVTSFLNGEFDALVVAALLPVRYVGLFAAAHQVATAARTLPLFGFPPLLTTLANAFAQGGEPGARAEFDRTQSRWLPLGWAMRWWPPAPQPSWSRSGSVTASSLPVSLPRSSHSVTGCTRR